MATSYEHPYPSPEVSERYAFRPLDFRRYSSAEMAMRADEFHADLARRRSVRMLSDEPVPASFIERAIAAAATAPSGANQQPWTFVAVSSPSVKREIRLAAESEERVNYLDGRMNEEWQRELAPLGTDWHKEFLEFAPWLVVLFEQRYGIRTDGSRRHHYYVKESCGIAAGMFIAALHHIGLATLTHTPTPMAFLSRVLGRPASERPFVLFPVGYPVDGCLVPDIDRKPLSEVCVWISDGESAS